MVFIHTPKVKREMYIAMRDYLEEIAWSEKHDVLKCYPDGDLIIRLDTDVVPPDCFYYVMPEKKKVNDSVTSDKLSFTFIGDEMEVTWAI